MTRIRIRVIRVNSNSIRVAPILKRLEKLNELLKEELSKIIAREIDVPSGALITITRIETTENKIASRVFFSVFESKTGDEEFLLKELTKQTRFIQRMLNRRLRIRPVPKIRFMIDKEEKKREGVEKLLSDMKHGT
ncbi:MAG: ribosome-binding factor A [Candidatus Sungbacteria bacterium RIFCSPLOWO2_12_FULL_41_11]|uniref:Ribosome-binding factor A n=1 Tax=Candidatus Sungbacteria bacterium RIFCSPLOWO2_12_FULL_41_11 TaxID=1802286 RepID=A0A1G2LVD7_9BACT|nr:MAG: Ribosome-binding factor A [Parcubacteria group bacterium GW2011_GWA2_42_14]OHA14761.1 MAG: ribosome-binding factor A [Candidatus Sungbacteria bacterium RIFCSPLOWO2_12_FULL_41_11]